jgi:hypothetical protein
MDKALSESFFRRAEALRKNEGQKESSLRQIAAALFTCPADCDEATLRVADNPQMHFTSIRTRLGHWCLHRTVNW